MSTILVVDVGTSGLKAVLFGPDGSIMASAIEPIATRHGMNGEHEQDAEGWWRALGKVTRTLPGKVMSVAFSGSMQNLIALHADGRPAAPAVLYSDQRLDTGEVSALAAKLPADYGRRTGNKPDGAHTILRLMARQRYELPGNEVFWTFGAKDALTFRLTGRLVIDPTVASTTGLMDFQSRRWDRELLAIAGVDEASLPAIKPANSIVGLITAAAAAETGLPAGIPVFNGAGDAAAATWGAMADQPGAAYCYLGTTGWVAATVRSDDNALPRDIYTLADPLRADCAIIISPFLTAGAAMDWLSATTGQTIERLCKRAASHDEAPGKPLFLPYLGGERAPFQDRDVRGAFLGLEQTSDAGALALAVMEGIAFAVRHNIEGAGLEGSGLAGALLTAIGGGVRHPLQQQILADVLDRDIRIPADSEATTAAGIMRMVADKVGIAADAVSHDLIVKPRPLRVQRHARRYQAYLYASSMARAVELE
nr:FGGY family carbohydrate kinase [Mesorhizobium loti]